MTGQVVVCGSGNSAPSCDNSITARGMTLALLACWTKAPSAFGKDKPAGRGIHDGRATHKAVMLICIRQGRRSVDDRCPKKRARRSRNVVFGAVGALATHQAAASRCGLPDAPAVGELPTRRMRSARAPDSAVMCAPRPIGRAAPAWRNGRRSGLKIRSRKAWGFESPGGHQPYNGEIARKPHPADGKCQTATGLQRLPGR